jgi:hypothetical protein
LNGRSKQNSKQLCKRQIELKELEVELKKDRVKDIHASTKHMLKMASATEPDILGDLCKDFKSFFNSKNQGSADI